MAKKLSFKQRKFCYLVAAKVDANATQAYLDAGYKCTRDSARKSASKLLAREDIQAFIAKIEREALEQYKNDVEELTRYLVVMAKANISDFAEWNNLFVKLKDSKELTKFQTYAIAEVSNTQFGVKIKLHSKEKALEMLLRMAGKFNADNMGDGDGDIDRLLAGLDEAAESSDYEPDEEG